MTTSVSANQPPFPALDKVGVRLDPDAARAIIESYMPVDPVSAYYKAQYLALIDCYPDDFANRYNYTQGIHGHITSQAFIYNPSLDSIALIHHKKLDIWIGCGGHVEPEDADLIATAAREGVEESGLTRLFLAHAAPIDLDIHGFPARKDQPDHLHYDMRFLFTTDETEFVLNAAEGTALKWVPRADLGQYMRHDLANSRLLRYFAAPDFGV